MKKLLLIIAFPVGLYFGYKLFTVINSTHYKYSLKSDNFTLVESSKVEHLMFYKIKYTDHNLDYWLDENKFRIIKGKERSEYFDVYEVLSPRGYYPRWWQGDRYTLGLYKKVSGRYSYYFHVIRNRKEIYLTVSDDQIKIYRIRPSLIIMNIIEALLSDEVKEQVKNWNI